MGQWWATDIGEATGTVDLGFFNRATIYRLRLATGKAPAHAEWVRESRDEWHGTQIDFQMEVAKTGTMLRFGHAGWRAESAFVSCNTTWGGLMFRLKATVRMPEPWAAVHV